MKAKFWFALMFVVIAFGTLGFSLTASQPKRWSGTAAVSRDIDVLGGYDRYQAASSAIEWLEKRSDADWAMGFARPDSGYDLEAVEVIARSVTFPAVLRRGESLITGQYPNTRLFCVDAAYYAGRAMGLILGDGSTRG